MMGDIFKKFVKYQSYSVMNNFVSYFGRQAKIISDMDNILPRVVNSWLSSSKVMKCFKLHRMKLKAHIA